MFIIIEAHGGAGHAVILMNEDGSNKVFMTEEAAGREADQCQNGIVVDIE